jgi:hypothetical protein
MSKKIIKFENLDIQKRQSLQSEILEKYEKVIEIGDKQIFEKKCHIKIQFIIKMI